MKLLINLCAHDGIISHYTGVGTMVIRYIKALEKILSTSKIDYKLVLYTPQYAESSFGYNSKIREKHKKYQIIQVPNGSNKKANYGLPENWQILTKNTADIINKMNFNTYDKVITIYNDTPFAMLSKYLVHSPKHVSVWIPHSTVKIHLVDSAIENSEDFFDERLKWEVGAINNINEEKNAYVGVIGTFIKNHLIKEYSLKKNKALDLFNGEIIEKPENFSFSLECPHLFKDIASLDTLVLSFGRAEKYKNLEATMHLGAQMHFPCVVIAQSYYPEQPILDDYKKISKKTGSKLYIDPPFDFAKYILHNFKGRIIMVIPSLKETMGLIINEIRMMQKTNILLVANNIDGLKEQITSGTDGLIVNVNDPKDASQTILKYFNPKDMAMLCQNGYQRVLKDYNLIINLEKFLNKLMGV